MTRASDQHFTETAPVWLLPDDEPACDNPGVWGEFDRRPLAEIDAGKREEGES